MVRSDVINSDPGYAVLIAIGVMSLQKWPVYHNIGRVIIPLGVVGQVYLSKSPRLRRYSSKVTVVAITWNVLYWKCIITHPLAFGLINDFLKMLYVEWISNNGPGFVLHVIAHPCYNSIHTTKAWVTLYNKDVIIINTFKSITFVSVISIMNQNCIHFQCIIDNH